MRKEILLLHFIGVATLLLSSCRKDTEQEKQTGSAVVSKVNFWLDSKKPAANTIKANNVEILKRNLDFSKLRYETLSTKEKFLIIPIADKYKEVGRFEHNSILNLLLVIDEAGIIKRGNISEYIPEKGKQESELAINTFSNLYNGRKISYEGVFRFSHIGGRWLYQYTFRNGKFSSVGVLRPDSANNNSLRIAGCTKWYLVTTYYNSDGAVIDEVWQYIGTTCTADGNCSDPYNAAFCPVSDSGGGDDPANTCCISDPNAQFSSMQSWNRETTCGLEGIDPGTGKPTKLCTTKWKFHNWYFLWYKWTFVSITNTELEKESGIWKFKTIKFENVAREGSPPSCVGSDCSVKSKNESISADRLRAKLILNYTIENRILCSSWWTGQTQTYEGQDEWGPVQ